MPFLHPLQKAAQSIRWARAWKRAAKKYRNAYLLMKVDCEAAQFRNWFLDQRLKRADATIIQMDKQLETLARVRGE